MKIELIETILVCTIVSIRFLVFLRTTFKIYLFKQIVPKINSLSVNTVIIPVSDLQSLKPKELLDDIDRYREAKSSYIPNEYY